MAATVLVWVGWVAVVLAVARADYVVERMWAWTASANVSDTGIVARLVLRTAVLPEYGADISPLALDVRYESDDHVRVRIYDPNQARWEVPYVLQDDRLGGGGPTTRKYAVQFSEAPFDFRIVRTSDGEILFNSAVVNRLVVTSPGPVRSSQFKDQYIELPTTLPVSPSIYGLGERVHPLRLDASDGRIFTIFSNDHGTPVDDNLYGSHPFYLERRADGDAHGIFLLSTNGMDVVFAPGTLTFKIIGGIIDLFAFVGPTPGDVIAQYTRVVGRPHMVPYWVLGYHQCRWGYLNLDDVKEVVTQYKANNIPLDTMWTDIDYMERYRDFTFSPTRFPRADVTAFSQQLRAQGQRYMLIADPAISNKDEGYGPYIRGTEMGVWILNANGTAPQTGIVWPGSTVFPDWLNPNTSVWWENELRLWIGDDLALSGLWIDMNEVDNFQTLAEFPRESTGVASVNDPPYDINNQGNKNPLIRKTIAMDSIHYGGVLEYDAHSLYGHTMSIATRAAIDTILGRRGLVLSRSTFSGTGKYAGHWLGDNTSRWADLYYSITGMLSFQLFGIPLVGADICGFVTSTTEELCARWTSVGSFYTFARNHNAILMAPQEPYLWPSVAEAARRSLRTRYRILPYYYTLFYQAHTAGATVLRPLFFEFATEAGVDLAGLDRQFLVGSAVLISPVLDEGALTVEAYFPTAARWYSIRDGAEQAAGWHVLDVPLEEIEVHVRGGQVVPAQAPGLTTTETRQLPFELIVALDAAGAAAGDLYLDDGESLGAIEDGVFTLVAFAAASGRLVSTVARAGYTPEAGLGLVNLWGVDRVVSAVRLDGVPVPFTQTGGAVTVTLATPRSLATPFVLEWA